MKFIHRLDLFFCERIPFSRSGFLKGGQSMRKRNDRTQTTPPSRKAKPSSSLRHLLMRDARSHRIYLVNPEKLRTTKHVMAIPEDSVETVGWFAGGELLQLKTFAELLNPRTRKEHAR